MAYSEAATHDSPFVGFSNFTGFSPTKDGNTPFVSDNKIPEQNDANTCNLTTGFSKQLSLNSSTDITTPCPSNRETIERCLPANYKLSRRSSVSAESYDNADKSLSWIVPEYKKTDEQQQRLRRAVAKNFLFAALDEDQSKQVMSALCEKRIPAAGIVVIEQGAPGDMFYVVEDGQFDVYVHSSGAALRGEKRPEAWGRKVGTVGAGGSFGELALMYDSPRAASVVSTCPGTLWALDGVTFRRILLKAGFQRRRMYEGFLADVPILSSLTGYERCKIADSLETLRFSPGQVVIRQGDLGDAFYIVESGHADVFTNDNSKDPIHTYTTAEYFGELALLNNAPRAATVIARDDLKVASLNKDAFQRLLGPLESLMRRNDPRKFQSSDDENTSVAIPGTFTGSSNNNHQSPISCPIITRTASVVIDEEIDPLTS